MEHSDSADPVVRPATRERWESVYRSCAYATYFHSPEWADVWSTYFVGRLRPVPYEVEFGGGFTAILPLSAWVSGQGRPERWQSSPAGTFGGWISADPLTASHAEALLALLQTRFTPGSWRSNPYLPSVQAVEISGAKEDTTRALDLKPGLAAIMKAWTKGHSSAAKKAERLGVRVSLAQTMDDWRAYFEIYEKTLERWGEKATSRYEWRLFESLCRLGSEDVRLWLAKLDGQVISGGVCFSSPHHVVYWHGAADDEFFEYRPVHLMVREAIRKSCDEQKEWFDFNPSGGHAGVESFKKGFGTQALRCDVFSVEPRSKPPKPAWKRFMKSMVRSLRATVKGV